MAATRRRMLKILAVAALATAAANQALFAHARGMGTLDVHEQGRQLLLTWVFYYDELPPASIASAGDPQDVKPGLARLALTAFELKTATGPLRPSHISQLMVLEDKTCLVILAYPVERAGSVEIQSPILRLLPVNYLINVRFTDPQGKTISSLVDRNSPPIKAFLTGRAGNGTEPVTRPFWSAFATAAGTPWIHTNWILLVLLLVVSTPLPRTCLLLAVATLLRTALVHVSLVAGFIPTWRVPFSLLCLPLLALAWLAARPGRKGFPLPAAAASGALILALYDLQFLPAGNAGRSAAALAGLDCGFAAGLALAAAILCAINVELDKFLRLHEEWRGRVCWGAAGISLWMSIYSLMG